MIQVYLYLIQIHLYENQNLNSILHLNPKVFQILFDLMALYIQMVMFLNSLLYLLHHLPISHFDYQNHLQRNLLKKNENHFGNLYIYLNGKKLWNHLKKNLKLKNHFIDI